MIISAYYGLIDSRKPIPTYNCKLTPARVAQLRSSVSKALAEVTMDKAIDRVFIFGGRLYLSLLCEVANSLGSGVTVQTAYGRPGERLAQLKNWLSGLEGCR